MNCGLYKKGRRVVFGTAVERSAVDMSQEAVVEVGRRCWIVAPSDGVSERDPFC